MTFGTFHLLRLSPKLVEGKSGRSFVGVAAKNSYGWAAVMLAKEMGHDELAAMLNEAAKKKVTKNELRS